MSVKACVKPGSGASFLPDCSVFAEHSATTVRYGVRAGRGKGATRPENEVCRYNSGLSPLAPGDSELPALDFDNILIAVVETELCEMERA